MHNRSFPKHRLILMPFALVGFIALFTYAVYALWNGVLAEVIPVKAITYWQALGLLVLAKLLFGGFPFHGKPWGASWRERMMAKRWHCLSPEEQQRVREEMRGRFGNWPRPWDHPCRPTGSDTPPPAEPPKA